jgi:O-antigen/teichoic acid export membrane protein
MRNKTLIDNVFANVVQAIISAAILFYLYRFISINLGIAKLGIWSVVLAVISVSRLSDLGLSVAVTRYVARDVAENNYSGVRDIIDSVTIAVSLLTLAAIPLFYPLAELVIKKILDSDDAVRALSILPYAFSSLWLTVVGSVFLSALDGIQRMDLKALVTIAGQLIFLLIAVVLTPKYELVGLGIAQLVQSAIIAISSRLLLCRSLTNLRLIPTKWSLTTIKEMLPYGANTQMASICLLLLDPVSKIFLAKFGGAAAVGYFEIANQIVTKIRSLIVSANQAIIPYVTSLTVTMPERAQSLYLENFRIILYIASISFSLIMMWAGAATQIISGHLSDELILSVSVLTIAWGINIVTTPAYFMNMGCGDVYWNTINHLIMSGLNVILGLTLGHFYGHVGVTFAYAISIIAGSAILIIKYHIQHDINSNLFLQKENIILIAKLSIALFVFKHSLDSLELNLNFKYFFLNSVPLVIVIWAAWPHSSRLTLISALNRRFRPIPKSERND